MSAGVLAVVGLNGWRGNVPVMVREKMGSVRAKQGEYIYIAHFIHKGKSECFTKYKGKHPKTK